MEVDIGKAEHTIKRVLGDRNAVNILKVQEHLALPRLPFGDNQSFVGDDIESPHYDEAQDNHHHACDE